VTVSRVSREHPRRLGGQFPFEWEFNLDGPHAAAKLVLKLAANSSPVRFDTEGFALCAKNAGMRYSVIRAKQRDRFAMYDSEVRDYNIVCDNPFAKDPTAAIIKG